MRQLEYESAAAAVSSTDGGAREPREAWQALLARAPVLEVAAARQIAGDQLLDRAAAAILEGVVRVYTGSPGERQLTLRYCRPGDVFGLTAAIAGPSGLRAEAVTNVVLAVLPASSLHELALRDPAFTWSLMGELAVACKQAMRVVTGVHQRSTLAQVAFHLLEWGTVADGATIARVNHQQLADATGTAREVVTRALASLRDTGLVETRRGTVVITDPTALARIANGEALHAGAAELEAQRSTTASKPPSAPVPSTSQAT